MPGCCSHFECSASQQFNLKKVEREVKRYRAKGPGPTTRLLVDGISQSGVLAGTVLDVGSGFGGLTLTLLERGASSAVAVDASAAYVAAARDEAHRQGRSDAIRFVHADFVMAASDLPSASIVTLDRVVCCYPLYEPLLGQALQLATTGFAISYPRDRWFVRAGIWFENAMRRRRGKSFRTFVHPPSEITRIIEAAGFRLTSRRQTPAWSCDVFVKSRKLGE
jgi:magnesium-protoporphyrin O-methyltransferase